MIKLRPKHERFCREYVIDNNATQAYVRAGYSTKGAAQGAERLLRKVDVTAYVDNLTAEKRKRSEVRADNVVRELGRIGLGDIASLYDSENKLKPVNELTVDQRALVGIKYADKIRALEMLSKHLGLFERDNEQKRPHESLSNDELRRQIKALEKKRRKKLSLVKNASSRDQ